MLRRLKRLLFRKRHQQPIQSRIFTVDELMSIRKFEIGYTIHQWRSGNGIRHLDPPLKKGGE